MQTGRRSADAAQRHQIHRAREELRHDRAVAQPDVHRAGLAVVARDLGDVRVEPKQVQVFGLIQRQSDAGSRIQAAMQLSYRKRLAEPIPLTRLSFGDAAHILHLPGESFMEYQMFAQQLRPQSWMAVASYGDCGPGYICMENSFAEGGYEPEDSFVSGKCEAIMKGALARLLPR